MNTGGPRRGDVFLIGWCVVLGVAILAPLAWSGYVLTYDMVFVPDQAVVPGALGLGGGLPRAVPQDLIVAVVDEVIPGSVLQRLVLIAALVGGGLGMAAVLWRSRAAVRAVAATAYVWNVFVFERLVIGHWSLLIAYATLPWVLRAGLLARAGKPAALPAGVLGVAVASLTPTGGVLAGGLLAVLVFLPGARLNTRDRLLSGAGIVLLQLPWVVPGALHPSGGTSDPAGVAAFAARPDSPLGLVGSLATFGGIWNADVVPDSRGLWSSAVISLVILGLAAVGAPSLRRTLGNAGAAVVGGAAVCGLVIALAGAVPVGADIVAWVVAEVPGGGLVRDGQKFLAWYCLGAALSVGLGAERIGQVLATTWHQQQTTVIRCVTVVAIVLPLAAMPDFVWGAAGRLVPVAYPSAWHDVRTTLAVDERESDLVVLPFQAFRAFPWNQNRIGLDPAGRYLGVETVVPDSLKVGDTVVQGEDRRAAAVADALESVHPAAELARLGIGWVVVERDTPGDVPENLIRGLEPIEITGTLDLYRIPEHVVPWVAQTPVAPVVIAVTLAVVTAASCVALVMWIACSRRYRLVRSARS